MKRLLVFLTITAISAAAASADLFFPDPKDTPGAINPEVTQANILETVCQPAWLEKNRPSASYIDELKAKQIEQLQLTGGPTAYEGDHLVPLCAGGHPTDPRNLWPQRTSGDWNYKVKNGFEAWVCKSLCRGRMTLEAAQGAFLEPDWRRRYMQWVQVE